MVYKNRKTKWHFALVKFYKDPAKYAFPFQVMAYATRLSMIRNMIKNNPECQIIICERSLDADKNIFAKMLYKDGLIDEVCFQIYNKFYTEYSDDFNLKGIIYIDADPDICFERIKKRARNGEGNIECNECWGEGTEECRYCDGKGTETEEDDEGDEVEVECSTCDGSGKENCRDCGGNGEYECPDCEGSGSSMCDECSGNGQQYCEWCGGSGETESEEQYYNITRQKMIVISSRASKYEDEIIEIDKFNEIEEEDKAFQLNLVYSSLIFNDNVEEDERRETAGMEDNFVEIVAFSKLEDARL